MEESIEDPLEMNFSQDALQELLDSGNRLAYSLKDAYQRAVTRAHTYAQSLTASPATINLILYRPG
jgi:hypothetical protein